MPYGGGGGGSGGGSGSGGGGTAGGTAGGQGGSRAYKIKFMGPRGVIGGGEPGIDTIDYITIGTSSEAADFGELSQADLPNFACLSPGRHCCETGCLQAHIFVSECDCTSWTFAFVRLCALLVLSQDSYS